jgi:hypothetical protein
MLILLITIITLIFTRKYFPLYTKQINTSLIVLSLWLIIGTTMRHFLSGEPKKTYTDMEMAQTFIKDNPDLCKKAKTRILDDGTIKIVLKKGKPLYLKDGVVTSKK